MSRQISKFLELEKHHEEQVPNSLELLDTVKLIEDFQDDCVLIAIQ